MIIHDLLYGASAGRRKKARKASALRWTVGICTVATAASMGIATGILIAPRSGKETRAEIKRGAKKTAATIGHCIKEKIDTVKNTIVDAAQEETNTL